MPMKSTPLHEILVGPLALACAIAVFIAATLDAPEDRGRAIAPVQAASHAP